MTTDTRQMSLFRERRSIDERFRRFHADHPEVYDELRELARALVDQGYRHLGIGMLWETLRYQRALASLPAEYEAFKLNDHYRSRYARELMRREPDLAGIFETRELRPR